MLTTYSIALAAREWGTGTQLSSSAAERTIPSSDTSLPVRQENQENKTKLGISRRHPPLVTTSIGMLQTSVLLDCREREQLPPTQHVVVPFTTVEGKVQRTTN